MGVHYMRVHCLSANIQVNPCGYSKDYTGGPVRMAGDHFSGSTSYTNSSF